MEYVWVALFLRSRGAIKFLDNGQSVLFLLPATRKTLQTKTNVVHAVPFCQRFPQQKSWKIAIDRNMITLILIIS